MGEGKATVADTPVTASEDHAPSVLRVNLMVEEPSASIAHARICGGPERAIVRSTRPITHVALYTAKAMGRGRYAVFGPEMTMGGTS